MYKLNYHPDVVSIDIPKLGTAEKRRIKKVIQQKLETRPEKFGIYLRDNLRGYLKLRIGDHRIIFRIKDSENIVLIFAIEHRSVAYKMILKRI